MKDGWLLQVVNGILTFFVGLFFFSGVIMIFTTLFYLLGWYDV